MKENTMNSGQGWLVGIALQAVACAGLAWIACNPKSEQAIVKTVEESAKAACQQFADEKKVTDFCNKAEEVQPFVDALLAAREKARSMVKTDAGAASSASAASPAPPPDAGKHGG